MHAPRLCSVTHKLIPTNPLIRRMYQREVDVDMLNAVKSLLAEVSSVRPLLLFALTNG